jgi:ubiquinone/menaquinone biosynthesis C-methylase UbiE
MVAILGFSKKQVREAVVDMYTAVANSPRAHYHFPVGEAGCRVAGYSEALLEHVPPAALESFAGVGNPFRADVIRAGDVVLDIGSGSGTDALIAAQLVGETGKVWALDTTPAMSQKLGDTLTGNGIQNVGILQGDAETIPLPDASVDVVTSNGVLNLVPDKRRAISEIFRVLRPGGRVQIADIVIDIPITPDCKDDPQLWAECVVGATVDESYLNLFRDTGFEAVTVLHHYDYFAHSPSEETQQVARRFGARALELSMRRAPTAPSPAVQWMRRLSPLRALDACRRRGLWGMLALVAALLACYGTLALVGLLSVMGAGLAINEGAWAGAITVFAALTVAGVAAGWRKHGSVGPLLPAILGFGLIAYTMFGVYSRFVELTGFTMLACAALWDYRLRRYGGAKPHVARHGVVAVPDRQTD